MQYSKPIKMIMPICIHVSVKLHVSKIPCLYRAALEENLKKCVLEKKKQHDILIHKQTQKERELRNLKKMELQLNMIYDSLEQDKSQHKRLKAEVCMNALIIRILNFLVRNLPMKSFHWS